MSILEDISIENEATKEEAKKINPINKDTVHRICSGQVVLNLAIAVKELVENSLDAGATVIEVRLKEYGEELVEVLDNGYGVVEENFSGLTLKYHTSKLKDFSDLLGVTTFGFRGEALSSLCALSDLTITTRHSSSDTGTKITYDHKGEIKCTTPCARQVGTTVSLSNIFSTLPVRQKEFHRNIKREFNKMTQLLYAYCLVSTDVKIMCTNQPSNGHKSIVVATQGGSLRENIASVFGVKQLQSILELEHFYPTNYVGHLKEEFFNNLENTNVEIPPSLDEAIDVSDIKSENELELSEESNDAPESNATSLNSRSDSVISSQLTQESVLSLTCDTYKSGIKKPFDFTGYISSCAHGSGRSSTDRQFYYVNSRPCEPNKVMKLINEVYRSYNPHQSPFVFLNLKIKRSIVDVNVTPDKRKVFFDREKHLMEVLKFSLNKIYENVPSTLKLENLKSELKQEVIKNDCDERSPRIFTSFLSQFAKNKECLSNSSKKESRISNETKRKAVSSMDNYVSKLSKRSETDSITDNNISLAPFVSEITDNVIPETLENQKDYSMIISKSTLQNNTELLHPSKDSLKISDDVIDNKETVFLGFSDNVSLSQVVSVDDVINNLPAITPSPKKKVKAKNSEATKDAVKVIVDGSFERAPFHRKTVKVNTSVDQIRNLMLESAIIHDKKEQDLQKVKFRNEINPVYNKKCEEELKKEISKEMFSEMKIVGQFNLGFIITQLENDLFIIDQHATDEKYNFETLQQTTVLSNQRLVIPQSLELSGVNERILIDNLEVCRKNGFTFEIDENALPTKRVKLLTVPISKDCVFGKEDIDELLFMLKDAPNELCRPSRVRAMFASRACRKSVMIGMALSKPDMRRLVDHMGQIEQPWNCPHGRPTIRHLVNMALTQT